MQKFRQPRFYLVCPLIVTLSLLLTGCNRPAGVTPTPEASNDLGTRVAATMTAVNLATPVLPSPGAPQVTATPTEAATATQTPAATDTPEGSTKNVRGAICYPGEAIPPMTVYLQDTGTKKAVEIPIEANQSSYEAELPPGTYQAYAWLADFSRGGLYSQAVACGLQESCKDHSPVSFEVKPGAMIEGVDICDWYGGPFAVPYPPGKDTSQVTGAISGAIAYPGAAPELKVTFFNLATQEWGYFLYKAGSSTYTLTGLAPGTYNVVAYAEDGQAGGHADSSHTLLPVTVKAGETTSGVEIGDWNAPAGSFPPNPSK